MQTVHDTIAKHGPSYSLAMNISGADLSPKGSALSVKIVMFPTTSDLPHGLDMCSLGPPELPVRVPDLSIMQLSIILGQFYHSNYAILEITS